MLAAWAADSEAADPRSWRETRENRPLLATAVQRVEPVWWFSPGRMAASAMLGPSLLLATPVACFVLWLRRGCEAYLPLFSEFGLHETMHLVFSVGMIVSALLLAFTVVDAFAVRGSLLQAARVDLSYSALNTFNLAVGFVVICGLVGLGLFPVDRARGLHVSCGCAVAFGGLLWAVFNHVISLRVRGLKKPAFGTGESYGGFLYIFQGFLIIAHAVVLVLLFAEARDVFGDLDFSGSLQSARDDFGSYCKPGGQRMSGDSVLPAAILECLILVFFCCGILTVLPDLGIYNSFQASSREV